MITVTRHPPEHDRPAGPDVAPAGCCCCCCCCCLHTIGGIIGAVSGSVTHIEPPPVRMTDPDAPFPFRRDEFEDEGAAVPAPLLYWGLVALLVAVTTVWPFVQSGLSGRWDPNMLWVGLFIAVMIFPALQLGASLFAFLGVLLFYSPRALPLRRVGRITLWSFAGSMIGLLLLGGCCGVMYLGVAGR